MDYIHIHPMLSSWPQDIKRDLCFVAAQGFPTYYNFMIHQSCNSRLNGNEVVRDACLVESLVQADSCRLSSWSFSNCLQYGPLKIHYRIILGITFQTTPSIQFWKVRWYLSVFHVSSKISGLSVVFAIIRQAWKHELIVGSRVCS